MEKEERTPSRDALMMEYISSHISLRKLAEKYGINTNTVFSWARREHWEEKRQESARKAHAKIIQKSADKRVRLAEAAQDFYLENVVYALKELRSMEKLHSTRIQQSVRVRQKKYGDNDGEEDEKNPREVTTERNLKAYSSMVTEAMRVMGLDAASIQRSERLDFQIMQEQGVEEPIGAGIRGIDMNRIREHLDSLSDEDLAAYERISSLFADNEDVPPNTDNCGEEE